MNSLNIPVIKRLIAKDWLLFQKQLAAHVLAGAFALCLLGLAKPWAFYLGSLLLIIVLVAASCFSISTSLVNERRDQTLAFVMSLPISPLDFYLSKLAGNLITFAVPFLVLAVGTIAVILFTPLPDGLVVYSMLLFGHILAAFCVSLSVAMAVESEGWNIFAMISSMVMINPFIMGLGQIESISAIARGPDIIFNAPVIAILAAQLVLSVALLCLTGWAHCRKTAFY